MVSAFFYCLIALAARQRVVGKSLGEVDMLALVRQRVDYQHHTCNDKRHAEPLPHVQCHPLLKFHLHILDKFNKESSNDLMLYK